LAGVGGEPRLLLQTAAVFHDIGFVVQRDGHELVGADIVQAELPAFGYSAKQIATIRGLIMATQLPQSPRDMLASILADADLDLLGRKEYWTRHLDLRAEWAAYGLSMTDLEWYQNQLNFLRGHQYFLSQTRALRGPQKQANMRQLEHLVAECEQKP